MSNFAWWQYKRDRDEVYTRGEVKKITDAYRDIFGPIGSELRAYLDLDRKRAWSCLTTDFHNATFEQFEEASRRALEIERNICEIRKGPDAETRRKALWKEGEALRDVTRRTGVGSSLGLCPWTDVGLLQAYEQNKHKERLTIILGHDWYPIVPNTPHPVDVPLLRRDGGLLGRYKWAVPPAIVNNSEMWLFLNFKPDFRPPNEGVTGSFHPVGLSDKCCIMGFGALVEAACRRFKEVQVISWGSSVWKSLRERVVGADGCKLLGIMAVAKHRSGRLYDLSCGGQNIPYLPLAHPCYASNFNQEVHKKHVLKGFAEMGLLG